jgi:MoaA/NifB/PqqE/SkfB family radical SAM enzyme
VSLPSVSAPERVVVWRITEHCNLGCGFCAYDRALPFKRLQADPAEVERVAALLLAWSANQDRSVLISWLGGEPLLWPPLLPLSARIKALGARLSLTSNGTRLHEAQIRQALLDYFSELTISIDAWGKAHEQLRAWPGGFDKLAQSLDQLFAERAQRQSTLAVRVNVVLMRSNLAQFADLCQKLSRWPLQVISFNGLGGRDRPEFYQQEQLLPNQIEQLAAMLPALRMQLAACGISLSGDQRYLQRLRHTASGWMLPVRDCQPGQQFLFIDERGRAAPCHFSIDDYGVNIRELRCAQDFDAMLQHFARRQLDQPAQACADCMSTQVAGKFAA